MTGTSFRRWLESQHRRLDAVGDIASEVRDDPCMPSQVGFGGMWDHAESVHGACGAALDALAQADAEWRSTRRETG